MDASFAGGHPRLRRWHTECCLRLCIETKHIFLQKNQGWKRFSNVTIIILKLLFNTFWRVSTSRKPEEQYLYSLVSNQKAANIVYSRTIHTIVENLSLFCLKNWEWEVESYRSIQCKNCNVTLLHTKAAYRSTECFHISKSSKSNANLLEMTSIKHEINFLWNHG